LSEFVDHLYYFFLSLGGVGLLLLGILDSSFLFMPLGNDLLIIGLVASRPARLALYVTLASLGSAIGCTVVDWLARKGGEEGLERFVPKRRLEYVKGKVRKSAGWALALAALMPPPFPFTPFVAAVAAANFSRRRFYIIIFTARYLRFTIVGLLALSFGHRITDWAKLPVVRIAVLGLLAVCVIGSLISIWTWIHRGLRFSPQTALSRR
jgi:membrane protein YqaA with SNARE-associated domain